jgi:hypothetical protein
LALVVVYEEAPAMRSRLRPKHTVQPAKSRSRRVAKVSQNPGAVTVCVPTFNLSVWCFKYANNAISMAKAMRTIRAARNEIREDTRVTVVCVEKDKTNAKKITTVATGCTASPRVHEGPIMTLSLSLVWYPMLYA